MHLKTHPMRSENRVSFDIAEAFKEISEKLDEIQKEMSDKSDRTELESVRLQLENVRINGSTHAQQAIKELVDLRAELTQVRMSQASKDAVEQMRNDFVNQGRSMKLFWVGLAVSIFGIITGNLIAVAAIAIQFLRHP